MGRALVIASLLVSAPAFAQDEATPQLPPAPAYGSARTQPMSVRATPIIGFAFEGAAPFGDFGRLSSFGFQVVGRGGVELLIGPGIYIAPDGEINFVRFGATNEGQSFGLSSAIAVGFMFGGRFGFQIADLAVPYFDLHFGYYHGQAFGPACDAGADCGNDKFAMEFGFGSIFWVSPTFGIGPSLKFNFDFTDNITANWFSFGPDLVFRL